MPTALPLNYDYRHDLAFAKRVIASHYLIILSCRLLRAGLPRQAEEAMLASDRLAALTPAAIGGRNAHN